MLMVISQSKGRTVKSSHVVKLLTGEFATVLGYEQAKGVTVSLAKTGENMVIPLTDARIVDNSDVVRPVKLKPALIRLFQELTSTFKDNNKTFMVGKEQVGVEYFDIEVAKGPNVELSELGEPLFYTLHHRYGNTFTLKDVASCVDDQTVQAAIIGLLSAMNANERLQNKPTVVQAKYFAVVKECVHRIRHLPLIERLIVDSVFSNQSLQ